MIDTYLFLNCYKINKISLIRLFVEKLPKHPDYKSAPATEVNELKKVLGKISQARQNIIVINDALNKTFASKKYTLGKIKHFICWNAS